MMKIANIMNFARGYNSVEKQFEQTAREPELVNEMGLDNTFLLQYDAVCCELYQIQRHINPKPAIKLIGNSIEYEYKGNRYFLNAENATLTQISNELIEFAATEDDHLIFLYPTRCAANNQ